MPDHVLAGAAVGALLTGAVLYIITVIVGVVRISKQVRKEAHKASPANPQPGERDAKESGQ